MVEQRPRGHLRRSFRSLESLRLAIEQTQQLHTIALKLIEGTRFVEYEPLRTGIQRKRCILACVDQRCPRSNGVADFDNAVRNPQARDARIAERIRLNDLQLLVERDTFKGGTGEERALPYFPQSGRRLEGTHRSTGESIRTDHLNTVWQLHLREIAERTERLPRDHGARRRNSVGGQGARKR